MYTLNESMWHSGPSFLYQHNDSLNMPAGWEAKQPTEADAKVRSFIQVLATQVPPNTALGTSHFSRLSKWTTLIKAVASLSCLFRRARNPEPQKAQKCHHLSTPC